LPIPPVPTLYSDVELSVFEGTTLAPATKAKLRTLHREFKTLRTLTKRLDWIAELWWDVSAQPYVNLGEDEDEDEDEESSNGLVQFSDWAILDAMYRSRALEWPGQGEAMVPGIDMANHVVPPNAMFDAHDGAGYLLLKAGQSVKAGQEIFISYGDEKSAMEMLFSYGFLPTTMQSTHSVLVPLPGPADDPLGPAKVAVTSQEDCVPGVRVFRDGDSIQWSSEVLWLMIVNEEDGLDFKVVQTDDNLEISTTWKGEAVKIRDLRAQLETHAMWDLFQLRATVTVLAQVQSQLARLQSIELASQTMDQTILQYAGELRGLEENLLETAIPVLESKVSLASSMDNANKRQKQMLVESEAVKHYFQSLNETIDEDSFADEDFS
jgi:SET domain